MRQHERVELAADLVFLLREVPIGLARHFRLRAVRLNQLGGGASLARLRVLRRNLWGYSLAQLLALLLLRCVLVEVVHDDGQNQIEKEE